MVSEPNFASTRAGRESGLARSRCFDDDVEARAPFRRRTVSLALVHTARWLSERLSLRYVGNRTGTGVLTS
jgi:hypothetical protein